ncbi:MAG: KamA family radical SAM protein [Syntrophorhabdaceae bacterium]
MAKKNRLIRHTTKRLGRKTDGPIFWRCSKIITKSEEEGSSINTLPFLFSLAEISRYSDSFDPGIAKSLDLVVAQHKFRIPLHYLKLIDFENPVCPIKGQAIPSIEEINDTGTQDPLDEETISVTPILLKRHPDRCVFLVSSECAMYCRFCNRRRFAGKAFDPEPYLNESFAYIENDPNIKEVILSGGDPFMLDPGKLESIVTRLRSTRKELVIRLSTRLPIVYPQGFTAGHLKAVRKALPLWIVVHINHPREITEEFLEIIRSIREAGAGMVSQTVLLRNINDCPYVLLELFQKLISIGIKPYYLFQLDDVRGASHFKVKLARGREIMRYLYANASGLAIPRYALDIPGGLGKIPIDSDHVRKQKGTTIVRLISPNGMTGYYDDNGEDSTCMNCGICKREKA